MKRTEFYSDNYAFRSTNSSSDCLVLQDLGEQAVGSEIESQEATVHLRARTQRHLAAGDLNFIATHFL